MAKTETKRNICNNCDIKLEVRYESLVISDVKLDVTYDNLAVDDVKQDRGCGNLEDDARENGYDTKIFGLVNNFDRSK